ncbi:LacI family DNA-binding transcriptional regulator [Streptomyces sp. NPDC051554]|uniref:LacI family DNA-binding transcriptional regulator n=1 Tax=Streptomyces sp. NPDC051554 TaxID=3365656 RepID=UPI003792D24B
MINDYEHVSEQTRTVVREAIDALGHRVNIAGPQLRQGRTGMITLAAPQLDVAYFSELARDVMEATGSNGRTVLIHQTGAERDRELAALHGFDTQFCDGAILSPLSLLPRDRRMPVVLLGERSAEGHTEHVGIDNVRTRTDGYRQALAAAGLLFDAGVVVPVVEAYHWRDGAEAAGRLMRDGSRPDALLCLNDNMALGALRALHESGVRVPGGMDVVSFDGIEAAGFSVPGLTSVSPDKREIARTAVSLLLNRIDAPTRAFLAGMW